MSRRTLLIAASLGALVAGWYWFRPERAVLDDRVNESFAEAATAAPVLTGLFHSNAHPTTGTATIYRMPDGRLVLRLTDFETSNGPDVQVYLVAAPDVNDDATVKRAEFLNLGTLKGNIGDQNYEVPAGVDLTRYRAVSIWCRRFSVNFGAAPLS
jgi:hypothetical protein